MSSETHALAKVNPMQAIIAAADSFGDDIIAKPSFLELVQPMSGSAQEGGAVVGQFRDKDSGMQWDVMNIVVLQQSKGRTYWQADANLGDDPICKSRDGKFPIFDNPKLVAQSKDCKSCEHASWANYDAKTKKGIPQCKEQRRILLIERDLGLVFIYTAKKMALKPINTFLETLWKFHKISEAQQKMGRGNVVPIYGFVAEMKSEKKVGPKGTYYVPKFGVPKVISDITEFGPVYTKYVLRNNIIEQADEAVAQVVEGEYQTQEA